MFDLKLLDCTLRDGGYINDWNFGKKAIPDMIEKLESSNVDILEIGFMKNEPYKPSRTVFNSMEQVKKLIPNKRPNIQYAVMCEVVNPLPLEMLEPADEDSADIIRVIVWKTKRNSDGEELDALQEGFEYCKGIVEKGYKLCVQPARVSQYSDEEFVAMVKQFAVLNPMAIYVVDSWGTENAESLLHYMHLADDNMPEGIALGYHGHNNMMQALGVTQAMLRENFNRRVIVDASVYGIGRGAGNLNLELIAKYLNEEYGKSYELTPMLKVCEEYVYDIYKQEQWGYSVPYYLTAKYNCNPNYVRAMKNLKADDFEALLCSLSEQERVIYKEETAKKAVAEIKKKTKLAVIIPTANRHQTIDNWLYSAVPSLYEHNIDVIIYDSSNDDKTKAVTQNFLIDGYDNVRYSRYDGIYDGFTLNHKVMAAYREFSKEYDYIWACRDGLIVDGTVVAEKVFPAIEKDMDLIVVNDPCRAERKLGYREYNDCKELFLEQCMQMTVLGASILKSSFISAVLDEIPLEEGRNYSLWQPFAFFEYLAGHSFCAVYIEEPIWTYDFKSPPVSFWKSKSMRQWSFEWSRNIENLPSCYDPYKKEVMKIHMSDFHPFAAKELLRIRASGGLTRKEIKENREKLRLVCDTPIWVFNVISFMPVPVAKWLASHAEGKIVKALQACFFLIRGNIPWEAKAGE